MSRPLNLAILASLVLASSITWAQEAPSSSAHRRAAFARATGSKTLFRIDDLVTHDKYGDGKIKEVFEDNSAWVVFNEGRPREVSADELSAPFASPSKSTGAGSEAYLIYVDVVGGSVTALERAWLNAQEIFKIQPNSSVDIVAEVPGDVSSCIGCDRADSSRDYRVADYSKFKPVDRELIWSEIGQFAMKGSAADSIERIASFENAVEWFSKRHEDRNRTAVYFGGGQAYSKLAVWARSDGKAPNPLPAPANAAEASLRSLATDKRITVLAFEAPRAPETNDGTPNAEVAKGHGLHYQMNRSLLDALKQFRLENMEELYAKLLSQASADPNDYVGDWKAVGYAWYGADHFIHRSIYGDFELPGENMYKTILPDLYGFRIEENNQTKSNQLKAWTRLAACHGFPGNWSCTLNSKFPKTDLGVDRVFTQQGNQGVESSQAAISSPLGYVSEFASYYLDDSVSITTVRSDLLAKLACANLAYQSDHFLFCEATYVYNSQRDPQGHMVGGADLLVASGFPNRHEFFLLAKDLVENPGIGLDGTSNGQSSSLAGLSDAAKNGADSSALELKVTPEEGSLQMSIEQTGKTNP